MLLFLQSWLRKTFKTIRTTVGNKYVFIVLLISSGIPNLTDFLKLERKPHLSNDKDFISCLINLEPYVNKFSWNHSWIFFLSTKICQFKLDYHKIIILNHIQASHKHKALLQTANNTKKGNFTNLWSMPFSLRCLILSVFSAQQASRNIFGWRKRRKEYWEIKTTNYRL